MTTRIRIGALALAAALWSGSATAGEHCHYGAFNGVYIGASVGYASLDAKQHPEGEPSLSRDDNSVIIGGHVGYNVQCGRVVIGVEGDLSYLDLSTLAVQPDQTSFRTSVDWLGTLRARLGLAITDSTLIYATGGLAWADRTHHVVAPNAPLGLFEQSDSGVETGWVVGGGIEFMRDNRWSLRAEVLRVDLDSSDRTYVVAAGCLICTARAKWDEEIWTARVGLSIKLGHHQPRYEPLK